MGGDCIQFVSNVANMLGFMGFCMMIGYMVHNYYNIGFIRAQVKGQGQMKVTKSCGHSKGPVCNLYLIWLLYLGLGLMDFCMMIV